MPELRIEQIASQRMQQEQRQVLRMEQADLLEISEGDFLKLIAEVEKSTLFRKLFQQDKLIRYQRLPRSNIARGFFELKEETISGGNTPDVESLVQDRSQAIDLIRRLGEDRFKKYFLFPESGMAPEDIAQVCNLSVSEVNSINELINDLSVMSEFYHPSALNSGRIRYSKIAAIEPGGGGMVISYFAPLLARGTYAVDYRLFEELKTGGAFSDAEIKQAKQLFKKLELINSRKNTVSQILQKVVEQQALYLESGKAQSLLPFSQKELAGKLGLAPSSISRAIRSKSIDTPWREEVPLKHFFPRPHRFKKELLKQLFQAGESLRTDRAIQQRMKTRFGVTVSRRSVASMRNELKIPAGRGGERYDAEKEKR